MIRINSDKFVELLEKVTDSGDLSRRELGKKAGVEHSTLSKIISRESEPSLPTVGKICEYLGLDPYDFLENTTGGSVALRDLPGEKKKKIKKIIFED